MLADGNTSAEDADRLVCRSTGEPLMSQGPYFECSKEISDLYYETDLILWHPNPHSRPGISSSRDLYVVMKPFEVSFKLDGKEHCITVPKAMVTDLASVPWALRWYVGRVGKHLEAAVLHDYLYIAWQILGIKPTKDMRCFSDKMMLAAMRASGVGRKRRKIIYKAVSWFGRSSFFSENSPLFCEEIRECSCLFCSDSCRSLTRPPRSGVPGEPAKGRG